MKAIIATIFILMIIDSCKGNIGSSRISSQYYNARDVSLKRVDNSVKYFKDKIIRIQNDFLKKFTKLYYTYKTPLAGTATETKTLLLVAQINANLSSLPIVFDTVKKAMVTSILDRVTTYVKQLITQTARKPSVFNCWSRYGNNLKQIFVLAWGEATTTAYDTKNVYDVNITSTGDTVAFIADSATGYVQAKYGTDVPSIIDYVSYLLGLLTLIITFFQQFDVSYDSYVQYYQNYADAAVAAAKDFESNVMKQTQITLVNTVRSFQILRSKVDACVASM